MRKCSVAWSPRGAPVPPTEQRWKKPSLILAIIWSGWTNAARAGAGLPTGSGVTEAGCKLLVKKRLCGPGMTRGFTTAGHILRLGAPARGAGGRWKGLGNAVLT